MLPFAAIAGCHCCCCCCTDILLSCFDLCPCLGQLINMTEMKLPKNFHTITHYAHPKNHTYAHTKHTQHTYTQRWRLPHSHTCTLTLTHAHLVIHISHIFLAVGFQVDCKIHKRTLQCVCGCPCVSVCECARTLTLLANAS